MPQRASAPRVAALVGPYSSGKTTLLESFLFASGAIRRKGTIPEGNTVGDSSPEAREREMSVELNIAEATYLDGPWTFLDCPGSVEFSQDTFNALSVADVALVVCDPDPARAVMLTPMLRFLEQRAIPHMIFINKMDTSTVRLAQMMEALQAVSSQTLVAREVPIRDAEGHVTGYVDLVSERAYNYRPGQESALIQAPESVFQRRDEERKELLENLADFDDSLLESLLSDVVPPKEAIYETLTKDLNDGLVVPVFFGSALNDNGVRRVLKALRHEVSTLEETRSRFGIEGKGPVLQVFKTQYVEHIGKMSVARIWKGTVKDGLALDRDKINGLFGFPVGTATKILEAPEGAVVGLGRLEMVNTGHLIGGESLLDAPPAMGPLFSLALHPRRKGDDVKLTTALAKLCEEDASLKVETTQDTKELLIWGQGDIHLQVALDKLARQFHVEVDSTRPQVPYMETIRKEVHQQGRFKRQTGGHGQYGDVHLTISPLARGEGFRFSETVTGGVVPRQYFPAVEAGVREALTRGPLGFSVVDVSVVLTDGSYHTVDSSEQAFKSAGALAIREGIPKAEPVLLEPVLHVEILVPSESTSKAQRALTTRRGQILGYEPRDGWPGWDVVSGYLPQAEMDDLIVEIRSVTMGMGRFHWSFHHLQELTGRTADEVVEARRAFLQS